MALPVCSLALILLLVLAPPHHQPKRFFVLAAAASASTSPPTANTGGGAFVGVVRRRQDGGGSTEDLHVTAPPGKKVLINGVDVLGELFSLKQTLRALAIADQEQELSPSKVVQDARFGHAVAMDGPYAIVGAPHIEGTDVPGAAYVFEQSSGSAAWLLKAVLTPSTSEPADEFGWSVALSGTYAIVGATYPSVRRGVAHVFERDSSTGAWLEAATLTASDSSPVDYFGISVAISGSYAIVGAHLADGNTTALDVNSGSAYVFERNSTTGVWKEKAQLTASDAKPKGFFGWSVAIDGTRAIVGAEGHGNFTGSAYVFERVEGVWTETAKLTPSDAEEWDSFGHAVALSGPYVIVGAPTNDNETNTKHFFDLGSAYIFELDGGSGVWTEQARLSLVDNPEDGDNFGFSVAIQGNRAVVGAVYNDDAGTFSNSGSVHVFERGSGPLGLWKETTKLTASNAAAGDLFGWSVAVSGSRVLAGARTKTTNSSTGAGAAFFFETEPW